MQHDILRTTQDVTELKLKGGKIIGVKNSKIQKSAGRIFKNQQIFSSAIIGDVSAAQLLETAEQKGNVGINYDYDLPQTAALHVSKKMQESREVGIEKYQTFLNKILKKYPHLNWSGAASFCKSENHFTSSYTGDLYSSGEYANIYFVYKRFGSTEFADGYFTITGDDYDFEKNFAQYEKIINCVDLTTSIESKKYPVLLVDCWDIAERISRDLSPPKFHNGASFLSNKMGQKLLHKDVTLTDIGYSPQNGLFTRFDNEGVAHQEVPIFQQGVFSNIIYDLRQAHQFKTQSTGNGFRDYNTGISCKLSQLSLKPGETSMWEMLKSIPECLVVMMGYGGTINEQWDYSTPVQAGFLFKLGEPVGRVPAVTIKGQMSDFLGKDLIGISSDGYHSSLMPAILTQLEVIAH